MSETTAVSESSIYVMYGAQGRVVEEILHLVPPSSPIAWLLRSTGAPPAWHGVRQLMAHAAGSVEHPAFEDLIACHRPMIAILYPERSFELTTDELACSRALRADSRSHYTHSMASWQPLIEAAAELIAGLLAAMNAVVAIPELARLDSQTGHALLEAFRCHRGRLVGLHVGHDPALDREPALVWGVPVGWSIEQIRAQLCDYQLCPGSHVVWLHGPGESKLVPSGPVNAWNASSPDAIALTVLGGPNPPTLDELGDCVAAMRWSAEAYAFDHGFRIGVLLEPHRLSLGHEDQADHASLTAIAATNVHFVDKATPGFDERLYAMYERALELCADPIGRASLAIRLAFAGVERGAAQVAAYLEWAASRLCHVEDELSANYYGAWLAIANALHQVHCGDLPAAELHVRTACTALDHAAAAAQVALAPPHAARLEREAACARFMVLAHCAIHGASVDDVLASRWFERAERERLRVPEMLLFEVFHWVLLRQREDDRRVIYERCCTGIRAAERCWDARSWYLYRSIAADCAYRMGRPSDAAEHCRKLLASSVFGNPGAPLVGDVRPLALRALLRAGDHAAVLELANGWLADPAAPCRAEAHAMMAWSLAAQGDRSNALSSLDLAIDDAVARGEQPVMLRVAILAVQVMVVLKDDEEAKQALGNAWDLAEHEAGQFSDSVSAQDCVRLCVLHVRLIGATRELLSRALALLPTCMSDAETWWDVTELLDQLVAWCQRGEALPIEARDGLAAVRRFAGSRAEWHSRLHILEPFATGHASRTDRP